MYSRTFSPAICPPYFSFMVPLISIPIYLLSFLSSFLQSFSPSFLHHFLHPFIHSVESMIFAISQAPCMALGMPRQTNMIPTFQEFPSSSLTSAIPFYFGFCYPFSPPLCKFSGFLFSSSSPSIFHRFVTGTNTNLFLLHVLVSFCCCNKLPETCQTNQPTRMH